MKIIGVIPARLHSTRLPEKLLLPVNNKPLLWYTAHQASQSDILDEVIIAADHKKIVHAMKPFPFSVVLTSSGHKSGTDRIGEIAQKYKADFYINIQGDEPLIPPAHITKIAEAFVHDHNNEIVTLAVKIPYKESLDPNNVKVVSDLNDNALYFSRSVIPFSRDGSPAVYYKHIGIYGYRRDILLQIIKLKQTKLEKTEKLEQLRFLEYGFKIKVLTTRQTSIGVDTKKDFFNVKKILENTKKK